MPRLLALALLIGLALPCIADDPPDWDRLDWRVDRATLVARYLFQDVQPEAPWDDYVATLGPDETPLAELLAEFDALSPAARKKARSAAGTFLAGARIALLDRVMPLYDKSIANQAEWVGDTGRFTPGFTSTVTITLDRLARAVRNDPTRAEAWYHLAYFAGLAGDRAREERAHLAFFAVWDRLETAEQNRLEAVRHFAVLDRAWALRETGRFDECLAWLDTHGPQLPRKAASPAASPAVEALLIQGLVAAEQGQVADALAVLPALPLVDLPSRATAPHKGYADLFNLRRNYYQRFHAGSSPPVQQRADWDNTVSDNLVREHRSSSYLRRWVKAWTSLRRGYDPVTVRRDLGRIELEMEFQPRLAWRWWQDQGLLYEILGEAELARVCWARAAVYRPLFIFHPLGQGRGLPQVHGLPATGEPYFLAYGTFFVSGSLWSYTANAALASQVEIDALARTKLREIARTNLDACVRRGLHGDAARALRGRLAFLDGDYTAARADLESAWSALETRNEAPVDLAFMIGLCSFNREDWPAARPWLRTFTTRSPDNHVGWLSFGLTHASLGHNEEALAALDRAVDLAPDDATCHYNRGLVSYRLGQRDRARADFQRAQELWPENAQIRQMVAVVNEETYYDLSMAVAPVHMDLPEAQRLELAEELAGRASAVPVGDLAHLMTDDDEQQAAFVSGLEARYDADPSARNRSRLAQALLIAGETARVQRLLTEHWPAGLTSDERQLLLYADRELGATDRALAIANIDDWQGDPADVDLMILAATLLLDRGRRAAAAQIVERASLIAPERAALQDLKRFLTQSP